MTASIPANLVDYLEASASRWPERGAIVDPAGWSLTTASSTSAPTGSRDSSSPGGVNPGDRVGVIVPKGADAITAFLGIMKARAAYVPADYTAPPARNRTILADCEVKAAFLAPACAAILDRTSGPNGQRCPRWQSGSAKRCRRRTAPRRW